MDAIRDLHPGYFAFVMATGIISTGTYLLGPSWLSRTLLVLTVAGLGVLSVALVIRLARFRSSMAADIRAPERVFGFFTIPAGLDLLLVSLILLRWLTVPMTPRALEPPYWILMGATAITVLAGAKILVLPGTLPAVRATAGFVEGFSYALWAFGTWWIPLLVILGFWRHVRQRWPLTYEPPLWSVVFPLGMYSVATLTFGQAAGISFMAPLARVMIWVAVAAWILVAAAFFRSPSGQQPHLPRRPSPGCPPTSTQRAGVQPSAR